MPQTKRSAAEYEVHEALAKIAEIAAFAAQSLIRGAGETPVRIVDAGPAAAAAAEAEPRPDAPSCSLRHVPARLQVKAAMHAIRTYMYNAHVPIQAATEGPEIIEPERLTVLTTKYWGPFPRRLTVSFVDNTAPELRRRIVGHLNAWSETGGISFVETHGAGEVRISRGPGGYWSYLGTDIHLIPKDRPTMNLQAFSMSTSEAEYRRVVRHEAGHTLGFPHEHMRKELVDRIDPQKAYTYFWRTQRWDRPMVDSQVLTPLDESSVMGTPAEETSIMAYQLPGEITRDGRPITGGTDITANDRQFVALIYPRPPGTPGAPEVATAEDWPDWDEAEDVQLPED
jgi:hypothetical protein